MRAIGTVANEQDARRFVSHLLTLGIAAQMDPSKDGYVVWIRDEEKVEPARREFAAFVLDPANPRYDQAVAAANRLQRMQEVAQQEYGKNVRDIRAQWR